MTTEETTLDAPAHPVKQTVVTGTVIDRDGVKWINAGWKAVLVGYVGAPPIYIQDGTRVQTSFNGTVDAQGNFSGSLPPNDALIPPKTRWRITIFPLASCAPSTFDLAVTGATMNITTTITQNIVPPRFKLVPGQFGYADLEVSPQPTAGTPSVAYANTTTGNLRIWNGFQFVDVTQGALPANAMQVMPHVNTGDCTITGNFSAANAALTNQSNKFAVSPQIISSANPALELDGVTGNTDGNKWNIVTNGGTFELQTLTDAGAVGQNVVWIPRNGASVPSMHVTVPFDADNTATITGGIYVESYSNPPPNTGCLALFNSGDASYVQAVGGAGPRGTLTLRVSAGNGSALLDALQIDGSGGVNIVNHFATPNVVVTSSNASAQTVITHDAVSAAYYDSYGANPSTMGLHVFRVVSSDGSLNSSVVEIQNQNFYVSGTIGASGAKTFVIDHPLDADRKLVHACVEAPECAVLYRGEGKTGEDGLCTIKLPRYFEALTMKENRTILVTAIDDGGDIPVLVTSRIKDGKFTVRSSYQATEFFWEVKATRKDIQPLDVEPMKEKQP